MIIFGVLLTIGVLGIYYHNLPEGLAEARAAAFMAIVIFELVRLLIIRADHATPLFSNGWLILAVVVSLIFQVAIVYVPFLANLFAVSHIDLFDWAYMIIGSLVLWIAFEGSRRLLNIVPSLRED
jgi:Ca2+-transporting ATPase